MQPSTQVIIKAEKVEVGYTVWSKFYNLPKQKVLFLAQNHERNLTTLKIFSIDDLNTCLIEKTVADDWRFLNAFPDGTLLFNARQHYFV